MEICGGACDDSENIDQRHGQVDTSAALRFVRQKSARFSLPVQKYSIIFKKASWMPATKIFKQNWSS